MEKTENTMMEEDLISLLKELRALKEKKIKRLSKSKAAKVKQKRENVSKAKGSKKPDVGVKENADETVFIMELDANPLLDKNMDEEWDVFDEDEAIKNIYNMIESGLKRIARYGDRFSEELSGYINNALREIRKTSGYKGLRMEESEDDETGYKELSDADMEFLGEPGSPGYRSEGGKSSDELDNAGTKYQGKGISDELGLGPDGDESMGLEKYASNIIENFNEGGHEAAEDSVVELAKYVGENEGVNISKKYACSCGSVCAGCASQYLQDVRDEISTSLYKGTLDSGELSSSIDSLGSVLIDIIRDHAHHDHI
jgi:hypothetical protein